MVTLSEKQIIIVKAIHQDNKIKKSVLIQRADFSATALDNNLEILKKEGLLEIHSTKLVFTYFNKALIINP